MKSDNITCEFEVYAESQYANITNDDLGVFLSALVYPIEDGVLSKSVMNIAKSFVNSILNKKFFLKGENLIKKEIIDKNQKKVKKPKIKKKIYEESEASQETIKFENKLTNKLKNERMLLIRSLDNPKLAVKSSHKILFQKYKKFTDNINNESNKKNIIVKEKENNSLSHKRSKKRLFPLHPKPNIKIDYLTEMIVKNKIVY